MRKLLAEYSEVAQHIKEEVVALAALRRQGGVKPFHARTGNAPKVPRKELA